MSRNNPQSFVITGRLSARVLLTAHNLCRSLGIVPKSHWHALRTMAELTIFKLDPNALSKGDLDNSELSLLDQYTRTKGTLALDLDDLRKAEAHMTKLMGQES